MKNLLFSLTAILFLFTACHEHDDDHDHDTETDYDYHAHIESPTGDDKMLNDTLHILVAFESHTGEPVHNIAVQIYNKADNKVVYSQPADGHVHATSGSYEFEDTFVLSEGNGVAAHTDWVVEAKVWGHEGTEGEVTETVTFHLHPQ